MKTGIQVSSLKPVLLNEEQVDVACAKMKALGSDVVQLQWIDKSVSTEFIAKSLEKYGIESVSVQDFYEAVAADFDYYVRLNDQTRGTWMCISRIPQRLKTPEGLDVFVQELRGMQKILDAHNQKLCLHPVSDDYRAVPGMNAVDYILESYPELELCIDLYHLNRCCDDMPAFIRKYAGRVCMVHFKESKDGVLCPAGQGDIDWTGVVEACLETNVPYAFVEQEKWDRDPYDCLGEALTWLRGRMEA